MLFTKMKSHAAFHDSPDYTRRRIRQSQCV